MQQESLSRQMREIDAKLQHEHADWADRMAAWEEQVKQNQPEWSVLSPDEYSEPGGGAKLSLLKDNSMLCAGYAPTKCDYRVAAKSPLTNITAVRLETLLHPNLPCGGPGRAFKGTFALSEIKIEAAPIDAPDQRKEFKISGATADYEQPESPLEPNFDDKSKKTRTVGPLKFAFDGSNETGWGIDAGPGRRNQDRKAVFQLAEPINFPNGAVITVTLRQHHGGWNSDDHQNNLLGRFRLAVTTVPSPAADPLPKRVRESLAVPREMRGRSQTAEVFAHWRTTVANWKAANDQVESLWSQWPTGATTLVLQPREEPRETAILKRGDFLKPAMPVTAGVPSFLHQLPPDASPTRLTFARWLADRRSPTTARVLVNRVWQAYFGTGLVATSEDFGLQSEAPSHPELLDWLACEFMDQSWSLKSLHRQIVTSATYRQSSKVTPELFARDQYNRLLAHGPRLRVEGEIVRDVALAASGLLSRKIGGPSVMPPAPAFLFLPPASYAPFPWVEATGEDRYRRALYTFRRRSTPYPMLANFDVPNADMSCVRRARSNTPMQALTTLNETLFVESAQALAKRILAEGGGNDEDRVRYGFRLCTSRTPTDDERQELVGLLHRQQERLTKEVASAWKIATGKEEPSELPAGVTPPQLAAYTVTARVLLNLDETITKE
jgi:hypothetical protein